MPEQHREDYLHALKTYFGTTSPAQGLYTVAPLGPSKLMCSMKLGVQDSVVILCSTGIPSQVWSSSYDYAQWRSLLPKQYTYDRLFGELLADGWKSDMPCKAEKDHLLIVCNGPSNEENDYVKFEVTKIAGEEEAAAMIRTLLQDLCMAASERRVSAAQESESNAYKARVDMLQEENQRLKQELVSVRAELAAHIGVNDSLRSGTTHGTTVASTQKKSHPRRRPGGSLINPSQKRLTVMKPPL